MCFIIIDMKLEFHGAAGGVTGSHTVLDCGSSRIGVDAGLFQGLETNRNQLGFGHDPHSLRALLLTHAHIDHSGRVPLLVREGFRGPAYATPATADLCGLMLRDSARLMEEGAGRIDESAHQRHRPDRISSPSHSPLYREEDVTRALRQFHRIGYGRTLQTTDFSAIFHDAGHILGSAIIEIACGGRKVVFSGDLGRPGAPFLRDPEGVEEADHLVLESTYGERDHGDRAGRGRQLMEVDTRDH